MIDSLTEGELYSLPFDLLVGRMDRLISQSKVERGMPLELADHARNSVHSFMTTKKVSALAEDHRRRLAYIAFSFHLQLEMHSTSSGMTNRELFNSQYDEKASWISPAFRLRHGAINQYLIISSRIAMEIFMDLLYCIEKGERLRSKKSKLKAFKNFLIDVKNPFHYFAAVLVSAHRFDRKLRTPEVHGTPSLVNRILLLQVPDHAEMNEVYLLSNVLGNCWQPLCELLDDLPVGYSAFDSVSIDWYETYLKGTPEQVEAKLEELFTGLL